MRNRRYVSVNSYANSPGEYNTGECTVDPTGYVPHQLLIQRMLSDGVAPDVDEARTYYEHEGPITPAQMQELPYNPTTGYHWDIVDAQVATEEMEARIAAAKSAAVSAPSAESAAAESAAAEPAAAEPAVN